MTNLQGIKLHFVICCFFFWSIPGSVYAVSEKPHFRGHYIWGPEVHSFRPCDSTIEYWVHENSQSKQVTDFYLANTTEPYQSIYLVFDGELSDKATDGFAQDYDGLIVINELLSMQTQIPNDCS